MEVGETEYDSFEYPFAGTLNNAAFVPCPNLKREGYVSRTHSAVKLGASPRAASGLQTAAAAVAMIEGRSYVVPDDVKRVTPHVLQHRLILNQEALLDGITQARVVADILSSTKVP